jgi:hypothetical protein
MRPTKHPNTQPANAIQPIPCPPGSGKPCNTTPWGTVDCTANHATPLGTSVAGGQHGELRRKGLSLRAISASIAEDGVKLSHEGVKNVLAAAGKDLGGGARQSHV